jgi:hypothetical protein
MNMPLYDQTDESLGADLLPNGGQHSQLCGPTSAAMVLAGQVYYAGSVNQPKGWTANSFIPKTWQNRVRNMCSLVSCSPSMGTMFLPWLTGVFEANGVAGRAGDFAQGGDGSASFWPTDIQGSDIEPLVRNRNGVVLNYGHYTRHDTKILGTHWITFGRGGGHFIAVSGFTRNNSDSNSDTFTINDPWGGVNQYYQIKQIAGGSVWSEHHWLGIPYWTLDQVTILPVIAGHAGYVINNGDYYGVLEAYTRLGVH